jgi:hypothetical protein
MRRIAIVAAFIGVGVLAARALAPRTHARMLAACEHMFEEMPDGFPPKRMLRGIEETRTHTARILELLEGRERLQATESPDTTPLTKTDEREAVVA